MIRINLLPYREARKQARQRRFLVMAVSAVAAGAVIVGFGYTLFSARIAIQAQRNNYLNEEIAKLDKQIAEIETLKKERTQLLDRKKVVERLQTRRSEVVQIMDQLVRQTPEGIYFSSVRQADDLLTVDGAAQSSARISTLMRSLNDSPMFEQPVLVQIQAVQKTGKSQQWVNQFGLTVRVTRTQGDDKPESATKQDKPKEGAK